MSDSSIFYTDPQLASNVEIRTDVVSSKHIQMIKLVDGRVNSIAGIPGDATNGLFVQAPQITGRSSLYAFDDDGEDYHALIGGYRMDDPLFAPQGQIDKSHATLTLDTYNRLNVTSVPFSGAMMAYDPNQTEKLKLVVPEHVPIGFTGTSAVLVAGVAVTHTRVMSLFLTFSVATGVKIYFNDDSTTRYVIGSASEYARLPANGQINIPLNEHGFVQSIDPASSLMIDLSTSTEVAGFVQVLYMPES